MKRQSDNVQTVVMTDGAREDSEKVENVTFVVSREVNMLS